LWYERKKEKREKQIIVVAIPQYRLFLCVGVNLFFPDLRKIVYAVSDSNHKKLLLYLYISDMMKLLLSTFFLKEAVVVVRSIVLIICAL